MSDTTKKETRTVNGREYIVEVDQWVETKGEKHPIWKIWIETFPHREPVVLEKRYIYELGITTVDAAFDEAVKRLKTQGVESRP